MKFSQIIAALFVIGSALASDDYEGKEVIEKCYDELKMFEKCYPKEGGSDEELKRSCYDFKYDRLCQRFWNDPSSYMPQSCSEAIGYQSISRLNDMDKKRAHFNEICTLPKVSEEEKQRISKECKEQMDFYSECFVNNTDVSEEELQENCRTYKYTRKCNRFWMEPKYYIPACYEELGISFPILEEQMKGLRVQYDDFCFKKEPKANVEVENPVEEEVENPAEEVDNAIDPAKEEVVKKCNEELEMFEKCYPKEGGSDEELKRSCYDFKYDRLCQRFWNDPSSYMPQSCSEAIGYQSISRLNDMDKKRAHFNEICTLPEVSEEEKQRISKECKEQMDFYSECFVNDTDVSEEELQENCRTYRYTRKCNRFWMEPKYYIPACYEESGISFPVLEEHMKRTRTRYDDICNKQKPKAPSTTSDKVPKSKVEGKCGEAYGACMDGYCCSSYGYCGKSESYCGTGCQPKYGICQ